MNESEALHRAWLKSVRGMTNLRMDILIEKNGSAKAVYERSKGGELVRSNALPNALYPELTRSSMAGELDSLHETLDKLNISVYCPEDTEYPFILKEIFDPPRVLFVRGNGALSSLSRSIAIVGSRNCSDYAKRLSKRIAKRLAEAGVTVVSGMALGVDAAAHEGAISSGEPMATIAVLASGVDTPSPMEHSRLYSRILEHGLVISEQPIGRPALAGDFPPRNRIIAGLSSGVLVAEARKKSGTWHTINFALDGGRDIFVLPGRVEDPYCEGSNEMLREGAILAIKAEDILERYEGWNTIPIKSAKDALFSDEEKSVINCLKEADLTADELFERIGVPMNRLLSLLTKLALQGIIERKSCMEYHYINY